GLEEAMVRDARRLILSEAAILALREGPGRGRLDDACRGMAFSVTVPVHGPLGDDGLRARDGGAELLIPQHLFARLESGPDVAAGEWFDTVGPVDCPAALQEIADRHVGRRSTGIT